jgi:hypothetical protein
MINLRPRGLQINGFQIRMIQRFKLRHQKDDLINRSAAEHLPDFKMEDQKPRNMNH